MRRPGSRRHWAQDPGCRDTATTTCHYNAALRLSSQLKERPTKRPHKLAVSAVSVAGQLAELAALGPACDNTLREDYTRASEQSQPDAEEREQQFQVG